MAAKEWYGARTIYRLDRYTSEYDSTFLYEERIVVTKATSFDNAIAQAEKKTANYAAESEITYLGFVNVFKIVDDSITNNTEIYSLVRESKLLSIDYLDRFFDTGSERTKGF